MSVFETYVVCRFPFSSLILPLLKVPLSRKILLMSGDSLTGAVDMTLQACVWSLCECESNNNSAVLVGMHLIVPFEASQTK